jgi:hypothetical protein
MKKTTGILAAAAVIGLWPALAQEPRPSTPKLPTVFVIGDSTASNVDRRGWADPFADYFDLAKSTWSTAPAPAAAAGPSRPKDCGTRSWIT